MLHEFVTANRQELIVRTRAKVALRPAPRASERELDTGVPMFLDQLAAALRGPQPSSQELQAIGNTAAIHGGRLLELGFTVSQVVHGYGDVCQAVTELAQETDAKISNEEFRTLNRCLDDAIAEAVSSYTRLRDQATGDEETRRSGVLAHELRNALSAVTVGFEMVKRGTVGPGGSVGAVITRNLLRMGALIHGSLAAVRLNAGINHREPVAVAELVDEAEADGVLQAVTRQQSLTVTPIDRKVEVAIDRQVMSGVIANLMQNAFKFTLMGGHVALRAAARDDRVLIEVEDECGGLPKGKAEELFGAFRQHGHDRSGLGLGLFISLRGVEANGGVIRVRDLPGQGCVFTIDLPRLVSDSAQPAAS